MPLFRAQIGLEEPTRLKPVRLKKEVMDRSDDRKKRELSLQIRQALRRTN